MVGTVSVRINFEIVAWNDGCEASSTPEISEKAISERYTVLLL